MADETNKSLRLYAAALGASHYLYWPTLALLLAASLRQPVSWLLLAGWCAGLWQGGLLWRLQLDAALLRTIAAADGSSVSWAALDAVLLGLFGRRSAAERSEAQRLHGTGRLMRWYLLASLLGWSMALIALSPAGGAGPDAAARQVVAAPDK